MRFPRTERNEHIPITPACEKKIRTRSKRQIEYYPLRWNGTRERSLGRQCPERRKA